MYTIVRRTEPERASIMRAAACCLRVGIGGYTPTPTTIGQLQRVEVEVELKLREGEMRSRFDIAIRLTRETGKERDKQFNR